MKPEAVRDIVYASGGKVIGNTRLQKTTYFLEARGLGFGFDFDYHYYGPYSEDLAVAARDAVALDLVCSKIEMSKSGAPYAIYEGPKAVVADSDDKMAARKNLLAKLADYDTTSLELAATADFLGRKGFKDPWTETTRRKSLKASPDRIVKAKRLLQELDNR